ncbi:hypothetical protein BK138_35115 [Paenibacillus rhizosphaerae]|uniref:Uncharacterized protein n=1 Tax=Paenibacillus rhizosphaerae TaxID=297318 RepID=A0A1R1DWQ3_9BACL|nr:hypothetical protein [Paenibacillus rhizosphaerae]OMF43995.1 hypothetical protein BK138_35115 [Paenibacillus rhizosphaerae]
MYIVAAYSHSLHAELVVSEIERFGISPDNILAIPLDRKDEQLMLIDTMHYSDGHSLVDLAMVLGTVFMLLGSIYGFVLPLGPIIWGLIGLVAGGGLGYVLKWVWLKRKGYALGGTKGQAELFIMIRCDDSQESGLEDICWHHHALGIGKLKT